MLPTSVTAPLCVSGAPGSATCAVVASVLLTPMLGTVSLKTKLPLVRLAVPVLGLASP